MAAPRRELDLLDTFVRKVADKESRRAWWKVDPVARQAVAMFPHVPEIDGIDLREVLVTVAKERARTYFRSVVDDNGLREYETAADGSGGRRWRKVREMTADDFVLVMTDYRKKARGLDRVIRVYEDFETTLRTFGADSKAADVYDDVIGRQREQGNL